MNREAMPATSKACASCRHQKKRCNGSCEYADLFPASRYDEFKNAQRLFGVGNIHNIIRAVDPKLRKEAAESILMEGNVRRGNPVHGCLGVAQRLKWEIEICKKQLEDANRCLSFFRQRDRELKRQRQGFDDALVELPSMPPSVFSNGVGGRSFYDVIQSNPTTTLLDSSHMNYHRGLDYQSSNEEGAHSIKPFDFLRMSEPWTTTLPRRSRANREKPGSTNLLNLRILSKASQRVCDRMLGLCLEEPDFESHGDQDR